MTADPVLRWALEGLACCPQCRACRAYCPGCGNEVAALVPQDRALPITLGGPCIHCGAQGRITVVGWAESARLEHTFQLPGEGDEQ
jgi:hypothetical protein